MDTQNKWILNYLLQHGTITPYEAYDGEKRITRLSGRIYELRRAGIQFVIHMDRNKENKGFHAVYSLALTTENLRRVREYINAE